MNRWDYSILIISVIATIAAIALPRLIDLWVFGNSIPSNISNEAWAGFLGSYIGGLCTLIALVATIHYYNNSDKKKEKAAIQPFLHVTIGGSDRDVRKGFSLPGRSEKNSNQLKQINIIIKNIGNGFATTLVTYTGANIGGLEFRHVIPVGAQFIHFS